MTKQISKISFKAAILERLNSDLVIKKISVDHLERGQVLVKMIFSGICRSQLMEITGERGHDQFLPHMLGHEGVGEVIEIGDAVSKVKIGDKVIVGWIKSSGLNSQTPFFSSEDGVINAGNCTTLSELTIVSENRLYLKPESLSDELAAMFGCAFLTGMGMAFREVNIGLKDTVMIYGFGGIGLGALFGSLAKKPKIIIVADISKDKRELAKRLGVNYTLDPNNTLFYSSLLSITDNIGVDICLEAGGSVDSIESAFRCINKKNGVLIFASHPKSTEKICIAPHELISGKKIKGTWGGGSNPDIDINDFSKFLDNKTLNLDLLNIKTYELSDVNKAIEDLGSGKILRPLIKFT